MLSDGMESACLLHVHQCMESACSLTGQAWSPRAVRTRSPCSRMMHMEETSTGREGVEGVASRSWAWVRVDAVPRLGLDHATSWSTLYLLFIYVIIHDIILVSSCPRVIIHAIILTPIFFNSSCTAMQGECVKRTPYCP